MARRFRAFADSIYGLLPYSVKLNWGLRLAKEEGYHPLKGIPFVEATITTLDNVWRWKVYRERGRVRAAWTDPRTIDKAVALNWTPSEGWAVQGTESGRRTRPLPKFIAAILCGTLIWVYPDILRITLEHAEKANNPTHVYVLLAAVTLALVFMIGLYMWFSYKAQPAGWDKVLAGLGERFGRNETSKQSATKTSPDAGTAPAPSTKADDSGAPPHFDDVPPSSSDTASAGAAPQSGATDAQR